MDNSTDKELDQQFSSDESFFEFDAPLDAMAPQIDQATLEEAKLIRRMQMMMGMVMNVIAQDGSLTIDDASQMIADARTAALTMFPGKELAYDLIWRPRFQRLMCERFRLM
jgi:hypothetical protein